MEGCEACGGVWLGPDAAVHVLRGLGDELEREIARASGSVETRAVAVRPADPGQRACPTCAQLMGRLTVGATVVDSCPAHGTWFDPLEIAEVIKACGALREAHAAEKASPEDAAYRAVEREGRRPQYFTRDPTAPVGVWDLFGNVLELLVSLIPNRK